MRHGSASGIVTPAQAGVQAAFYWIPACAGMTGWEHEMDAERRRVDPSMTVAWGEKIG